MISFEDTQIAFQGKSDREIKKAYILFKLIGNNYLVKWGGKLAKFALKIRFPVGWLVKPTIYRHFVGGESIANCFKTVRHLEKFNVRAILDYSVEGTETITDINSAMKETLKTIDNAAKDANVPFAVFKPTAFTKSIVLEKKSAGNKLTHEEQEEAENFRKRIGKLCKSAFDNDVRILIDAEDSWYQHFIDEVVRENQEKYNKEKPIVWNTYQMYRWDRLEYLKKDHAYAKNKGYKLGAKFVRGAYMEKERERAAMMGYPDPIQADKESTDQDYNAALKYCMTHIDEIHIFNGTHNEYSSAYLAQLMKEFGLKENDQRCWFSQLYGMSEHISFNLANKGYNVAKYLPFGPYRAVLPYLIRRTEENTSISGQTSRELSLLVTEINRRKKEKKRK